mgnify:CR=1 FL=1
MSSSKDTKKYTYADVEWVTAKIVKELDFDAIGYIGKDHDGFKIEGVVDEIHISVTIDIYHASRETAVKYWKSLEDITISLIYQIPFDEKIFDRIKAYLKLFKGLVVSEAIK